MNEIRNIHPGEILLEEFLLPKSISVDKLANEIFISKVDLLNIINKKNSLNADIAKRLSLYFGNSARFWLGLQEDYDLEEVSKINKTIFEKINKAV